MAIFDVITNRKRAEELSESERHYWVQWPFRRKLQLLLFIILLPAVGIIVATGISQRQQAIVKAQDNALLLVQSLVAQQEQIAIATKTMLSTLAHLPEVQNLDAPACNRILAELHQMYPFYASILAMTPEGYVFAAHTPLGNETVNESDRKYFQDAISSLDYSAGEYIIGRVSQTTSLNYSFPVLDANKKLVAVLTAGLNLQKFGQFISMANLPEGSAVVFLDHKGVRLYRFPENEATPIGMPTLKGYFDSISGSVAEGLFEWTAVDGIKRINAFKQLRLKENSPSYMYMVVGLPKTMILHAANLNMLHNLLILGFAALLALFLAWILANVVLIKPINRLVAATQQLGHGDMGSRTGLPHGLNELGRLARSFDDMASLLENRNMARQQAEDALKRAHDELEQRVENRTVELNQTVEELRLEIAERKRAEVAFKSLVSNAPIGIFMVQDGKFVMTNPWLESITGYPAQERLGRDSLDMVIPEDKVLVREKVIKMLKGQELAPIEFQFITRNGEIMWAMEKVAPTLYEGKKSVLGYFMDITPRKKLEAQFLQAQKMEVVGQLAGGVAHDFNNILASIMGYAEMMQLDLSPENPLHHKAEAIKKASERAASLTRQLLAFSRKQVQQTQVLNLNSVIGEMDKMLRRLIGEDIDLSLNLEPRLAAVKADYVQVEQILMNLVVNARDAMPSGGRLTIETTNIDLDKTYVRKHPYVPPGPYVMMALSDNGAGMDAETQSHIFEPFFTTKELGKGTGLGLSTVYGIVKQSQGSIEVYSEPGIGTTFKVYLPQVEADVSKAREGAQTDARLQGTETILVVEDEQGLRELICASLQRNGYTVLEAGNGHEALSTCDRQQGPIHLMLTDVVMPKLNGREIVERVAPMRPEMKVLFMSGYTEDVIIHHGVLDESMHFLEKPFMANVLLRKVRELLDNPVEN